MPQIDLSGPRGRRLCPRMASELMWLWGGSHIRDNSGPEKFHWSFLEVNQCLRLGKQNAVVLTLESDFPAGDSDFTFCKVCDLGQPPKPL